jgi:predicted nucleic acid-binding protein
MVEIGHIDLLPRLFERIAIPTAVQSELSDSRAPVSVRSWITTPPEWLEIHVTSGLPVVSGLDEGETAAIALAEFLQADLVLMDERDGFRAAKRMGLRVTGTLGVLDLAAERGLIDFQQVMFALEQTSFRRPKELVGFYWRSIRVEGLSPQLGIGRRAG